MDRRSASAVALLLGALLLPTATRAIVVTGPDVKVAYAVDATALKAAVSGTALTFSLYADASCTASVHSEMINVENTDLIESVKRITPKGAPKPPKTAVIHATLTGVAPGSGAVHKVTGTGITSVGGDCQAQAGGAASSPVIAYATLDQGGPGIESSGGNGTTSAAIDTTTGPCAFNIPPGVQCVTFTGSYPTGVAASNLTVLSTCESGNFGVSNNQVVFASDTSITVQVFCWESDTLTNVSEAMRVSVLYGM